MSVLEPDAVSMPGTSPDVPTFPIVMRGFDRLQVRAFIDQVRSYLAQETRRADQAEQAIAQLQRELEATRHQLPPSYEHLGAEAARVLEQAGVSARMLEAGARARAGRIVEDAETEAREVIAQAEQRAAKLEEAAAHTLHEAGGERDRILAVAAEEAQRLRSEAEQEARAIMSEAQEEAERIHGQAAADCSAMEAETERLRQSRDHTVEFLSRIHTDLTSVLAETFPTDGEAPPAAVESVHPGVDVEAHAAAGVNGDAEPPPEAHDQPA